MWSFNIVTRRSAKHRKKRGLGKILRASIYVYFIQSLFLGTMGFIIPTSDVPKIILASIVCIFMNCIILASYFYKFEF